MTIILSGEKVDVVATGEDKVFDALAIRDTADHDSSISDQTIHQAKTILIENGLNQQVDFECHGSRYDDFSIFVTIGSGFNIAASTNDYVTSSEYFPYMRLRASCATAPTTGTLTVYIEKRT